VLACRGEDSPSCLTPAQAETAKALYSPVKHPTSGAELYPALLQPGSELQWGTLAGPQPYGVGAGGVRYVLFQDPKWDARTFNAATDIERMDKVGAVLKTATADLRPFFSRGGKLFMYHGWNDQQ